MAMGRQKDGQGDLMVSWSEMPRSPGHVFYDRLQSGADRGRLRRLCRGELPALLRGRAIARDLAEGVVDDFETELPSAAACFMDDFEACIAHLRVPIAHRRATRTTNLLERLFVEERRRLKIIPNAFGEKPVLKLMFGAMIRAAERWRAIKLTDFERRQMAALRKELDHEYEAQSGLAKQPSKGLTADKLSSSS